MPESPSTSSVASPAPRRHRELVALGGIGLIGLLGHLALARGSSYPTYDGAYYLGLARSILHGTIPYSSFPPGWPSVIALTAWLSGGTDPAALLAAARVANAVLGVLSALLFYDLARAALGRGVALGGAAVLLILPAHVRLAVSDLSEISYGCALLASMASYRRGWPFASGLAWGIAYLIRPEALLGWAVLVGRQLVPVREGGRAGSRKGALAGLVAGCAVPVLPYLLFLWDATGSFQWSSKSGFLLAAYRQNPGLAYLRLYAQNAWQLTGFALAMLGPVLPVLAGIGLLRRRFAWQAALAPLVLYPLFSFRMEARYLIPYVPFLLSSAGVATHGLPRRPGSLWRASWLRRVVGGLALAGLAVAITVEVPRVDLDGEYYPGMRLAGRWLRERGTPEETLVVGRKPYVSFWAACRFKRTPEVATAGELLDWADAEGADYLVVHAGLTGGLGGAPVALLEEPTEELRRRLELAEVFTVPSQPNETTFLFRLRSAAGSRLDPGRGSRRR